MTPVRARLVGLLLLVVVATPGCFYDPDIEEVVQVIRHEIEPAELHPEARVKVGRGLMAMAKTVIGLVDEPGVDQAQELLRGVNEIHIGVYEVEGLDLANGLRMPDGLRKRLREDDWQVIIEVAERDGAVWIFTQGGNMRGVYIVALDPSELVVVKLEGNLSRTIDAAVREAMRHNTRMLDPVKDAAGV